MSDKSPEQIIDDALDSVLRASGSRLANYTMQKSLDDMRKAMKKIMYENYIQGSNDCYKIYFKDNNHENSNTKHPSTPAAR